MGPPGMVESAGWREHRITRHLGREEIFRARQRTARRIFRAFRQHRRSRQRVVYMVWPLHAPRRGNGNSACQPTTVTLKFPPAPNTSVVIVTQSGTPPRFDPPPQGVQQKGYATVLWSAHDDNEDELHYAVYYRGENERDWKLLKDKLEQKFYSWDTTSFPDGAYYLKIVATDAPSNPLATALTAERISERFEVDNTPPVIEHLQAESRTADKASSIAIKFIARDASSSVERAQYSLDGGDWILVSPSGDISDAPEEHYEFTISDPSAGEHTVAVRAYDRFENVGSAKTTVIVSGSNRR